MASIKEIAKKAQVSRMVVTLALKDSELLSKTTKDHVLKVAKSMNYFKESIETQVDQEEKVILLLSNHDPKEHYFAELMTCLNDQLKSDGYTLVNDGHYELKRECDGVIVMGLDMDEDLEIISKLHRPTVLYGKTKLDIDWVDIDNIHGMYQGTDYLIRQGHTNIGYVGMVSDRQFNLERYEGFLQCVHDHELDFSEERHFQLSDNYKWIENLPFELLEAVIKQGCTGLVCVSDLAAYMIMEAALVMDIQVPRVLSLVGFDGQRYHELSIPHITTMRQPIYSIAKTIADVLKERINNPNAPLKRELIQTTLVIGGTVRDIHHNR